MSLISMQFILFVLISVVGYYLIPKKYQWVWLLLFSYVYYASAGTKILFFLMYTTLVTYLIGRLLERENQSDAEKSIKKKRKRRVLILALILDFGMLAVLKYTNFAIANVNAIWGSHLTFQTLILPLGISFYTFQSVGYLIDIYWMKFKAEKNILKFALFVSFFPQILQGPISRFDQLACQFYQEHNFSLKRIEHGLQLILWGYFKKIVIADRAAVLVNEVFLHYEKYTGVTVIVAVLFYSIQLYGDFSGGMDVVIGVAELFDIKLTPNFKRPYFAISITDFWHRWHITLGTWMKDYVFYPISLSKWMGRFGKWSKKICGKKTGRVLPICAANIIVFLIVGIWHGAAWKFIIYGLYNGGIIAVSSLLAPAYKKGIQICHINVKSKTWHCVQIARTFTMVNISWFFDMALNLSAAFLMMKSVFVNFTLKTITDGSLLMLGLKKVDFAILGAGCLVWFFISFLQENKIQIRESVGKKVLIVRYALYILLLFAIPIFGQISLQGGGFIYAQF